VALPTVVGIIICIALCRCFYKCRPTENQEELRTRAHERSPVVYNIPISQAEEQPQDEDDLEEQYPPPPSYNE
ncbi:putative polyketide synthase 17, partial [Clarias magur]